MIIEITKTCFSLILLWFDGEIRCFCCRTYDFVVSFGIALQYVVGSSLFFIQSIHTKTKDTTWIPYRYVVKKPSQKDCTRKTSTKKRNEKKLFPHRASSTQSKLHMMNKRCFIVSVSFLSKVEIINLLFFRIAKKNKWKISRIEQYCTTLYTHFFLLRFFFIEKHELF